MSTQIVDTAMGKVELNDSGDGPAILVAHGRAFGSGTEGYAWLRTDLDDHRIITIARPGYGQTPIDSGRSFEEQGALIGSVLEAIDLDAVVLGVSNGGPSAMWSAIHSPSRVAGVVLWCAVATPMVPRHDLLEVEGAMADETLRMSYEAEMSFVAAAAELEGFDENVALALMTQAEVDNVKNQPAVIESIRNYLKSRLAESPGYEGMRNDAIQNQLDGQKEAIRPTLPALIVHGDSDRTVPLDHAKFNAKRIEGAELMILQGGSHAFFHGFRQQTVGSLRDFVDKVVFTN